jgi:hypothetical protein
MHLDLTDDEKRLLRNSLNSLAAQMDLRTARVFVSLVDKINALIPEQKAQPDG